MRCSGWHRSDVRLAGVSTSAGSTVPGQSAVRRSRRVRIWRGYYVDCRVSNPTVCSGCYVMGRNPNLPIGKHRQRLGASTIVPIPQFPLRPQALYRGYLAGGQSAMQSSTYTEETCQTSNRNEYLAYPNIGSLVCQRSLYKTRCGSLAGKNRTSRIPSSDSRTLVKIDATMPRTP